METCARSGLGIDLAASVVITVDAPGTSGTMIRTASAPDQQVNREKGDDVAKAGPEMVGFRHNERPVWGREGTFPPLMVAGGSYVL